MSLVLLYVTYPTKREAERVADVLLEKRMIACANLFAIRSAYRSDKKIVHTSEWVSLLKTTRALARKTEQEILARHSYKNPCVIHIPARANTLFESWALAQTRMNLRR